MSKIHDLIHSLCPEGVIYKTIGEVVLPKTNIKWREMPSQSFKYIDLTSVDRFSHAIYETQNIDNSSAPSRAQQIVREGDVIFGTTRPTLMRFTAIDSAYDGQICSTGFCVLRPNTNVVMTNFLFHLIGDAAFMNFVERTQKGASYPSISDAEIKTYRIPIPPLAIQKEIVGILDKFTQLEAELSAELDARRKQYDYYRNQLLTIGDAEGVRRTTLGEIGVFTRGNGPQKKDFTDNGIGCIHYGQIYTHYGTFTDKTKIFVSEEVAKKSKKAKPGNLVIATTSENDEDVCKAVAWLGDNEIAISNHTAIFAHNENPKYMAYLFQTQDFFKQKKRYIKGTKVKDVSANSIAKFDVSLPLRDEQDRIVDILDNFDALTSSISEGLPAEITARRKQYEYYRTKLLTFQELST